jgi:DNA repair exonuclease SbcCD ATPase subunit
VPNLSKITIDNYQSLAHAELTLGELTVLVGPGRSGKSAVIRALCSLLLNESGDSFIRFDQKEATVRLDFSDGTVVSWRKERGKSATYELNGKTFSKTGTQVPEEIAAYLGIGEIDVEQGFSLTPQLKDQFAPVFILSESGSRQARILGKITKLDAVVTAQMACKKRRDQLGRDASYCEKELERIRAERESLPDVASLENELEDINETLALVSAAQTLAQRLGEAAVERDRCRRQLSVRVDGVKDKVDQARELLEQAGELGALCGEHRAALQARDNAVNEEYRASKVHTQAQIDYDAACKEAKVCAACPWR